MAVAPNPQWLTLALAFLNPYDDAPVIAALKKTLAMPTGMALIWWGRSDKFRKYREGKTAYPKDRPTGH
jgi:hypothetical protein